MGAEVIKIEPPGAARSAAHLGPGRTRRPPLLLDGARAQQEGRDAQPAGSQGPRAVPRPRRALATSSSRTSGPARWRNGISATTFCANAIGASSWSGCRVTGRPGRRRSKAGYASVAEAASGLRHMNGFPGRPAAAAGAVAGRQPGRHVRRPGRAGGAVPPHRHRRGSGRRRRADRILFGRPGIHDSRLRRRRRGARPVGHPAGGHRAVEHLPHRRRQLGGDRRQPGHRVPPAVRGDGPARSWPPTTGSPITLPAAAIRTSWTRSSATGRRSASPPTSSRRCPRPG